MYLKQIFIPNCFIFLCTSSDKTKTLKEVHSNTKSKNTNKVLFIWVLVHFRSQHLGRHGGRFGDFLLLFFFFFLTRKFVAFKQLAVYLPPFPPFTLCLFTSNSPGYGKEWNMVKGKTPASLSPSMEPRKPQ